MRQPSTQSLPLRLFVSVLLSLSLMSSFSTLAPTQAHANGENDLAKPLAPLCPMNFADVAPADYFYESVQSLFCGGAVNGYNDNTFRPYNSTTRGQLSKIIVLAAGLPLNTDGGPHFSDVPSSSPFYGYIETAYLGGLISGYSDGTFRPNSLITRGQLTKVVVIVEGWPLVRPTTPTFNDVPPDNSYFPYVETAVQHAVISGYGDGSFRLGNSATRGQICKIIYTALVPFSLTPQEQQTVNLINERRAAMGLGAMRVNRSLTGASRRHSNDIGPQGLCQHNGTDGSSPWDRIAQAGYAGSAMGEVVGCGYNSSQSVVDGWWNSPGHYAILTDPGANDIGCGWWIGQNGYGWQTCDTGHSN